MKKSALILLLLVFLVSCKTDIKDRNAVLDIEQGTDTTQTTANLRETTNISDNKYAAFLGYYVGQFVPTIDVHEAKKTVYYDMEEWQRTNKINISIDSIFNTTIIGHSVVAGNDRPFRGLVEWDEHIKAFKCEVKEPGTDKYDGSFSFYLYSNKINGTWKALRKIDINERNYQLTKRKFSYNPNQNLEVSKRYADWTKVVEEKSTQTIDDEVEEWIDQKFGSATDVIYSINASSQKLTKKDVENLSKGDLLIIRNAIYARHGYSFKSRPLRVFFDAQEWYIPVHADIKSQFTDLEKENIKLLLKYEKNAVEYYDYFGRG
jgi:hypothetical protein